MDEAVCRVLTEYETRMEAENVEMQSTNEANWMARRDEFLLPVGPDTGRVLNMLIKNRKIVHRFDISAIDRRTTFKPSRASSREAPA
jgi:hypothetical protein